MIESEKKILVAGIISCYQKSKYEEASHKTRNLLGKCINQTDRLILSMDLAHLLSLAGRYDEAQPMLKTLVEEEESNRNPDSDTLEKLYLAYANCLFNRNDYIRFYYYINKYLKIAETSNPEAYSLVKHLLD